MERDEQMRKNGQELGTEIDARNIERAKEGMRT